MAAARPEGAVTALPALGPPQPFSFDRLRRRASMMAGEAFRAAASPATAVINGIDFDAMQKIRFRPEYALWQDMARPYPVSFFPLNKYASTPVKIHVVAQGAAREIAETVGAPPKPQLEAAIQCGR